MSMSPEYQKIVDELIAEWEANPDPYFDDDDPETDAERVALDRAYAQT